MQGKKPKIIFLGKLPPPYIGPAVATGILLKSKLAENYRLFHLDTSDHRDINTLGACDLTNITLPLWHYSKLIYLIIRHWPQAVYIPSAQTTVAFIRDIPFILIAKFFRKKVICHLRGGNFKNWYQGASAVTRWLVRRIQRLVDAQIVLGDCLVDMYTDLMPREKIFVVPNGGDFPVVEREKKKAESGQKIRILYLANFIKTKGVLEVLHASPEVFREFPNIEFVFAGSWLDKETQLEFIKFLNDHPELPVNVLSPVSGAEKFALLASADIFVFPTYYVNEGHPWVIIEAMASGLPIISTDHGAIREMVADGINGFLVDKRNVEKIAEKIKYLMKNSNIGNKMGEASLHLYESRLTETCMVNNMIKCFDAVLIKKDKKDIDFIPHEWEKNYTQKKSFRMRLENTKYLIDQISNKNKILDIGCGTGEIAVLLAERYGSRVTGMDVSQEMIEWCQNKYKLPNLDFKLGSIVNIAEKDTSFDVVLSVSVIEWIEDYKKAISEVARILVPGGSWIVSIPNWKSPFRKMQKVVSHFKKNYYLNYQKNKLSYIEFIELLRKNGFKVKEEIYNIVPLLPVNLKHRLVKNLGMMCIFHCKKEN